MHLVDAIRLAAKKQAVQEESETQQPPVQATQPAAEVFQPIVDTQVEDTTQEDEAMPNPEPKPIEEHTETPVLSAEKPAAQPAEQPAHSPLPQPVHEPVPVNPAVTAGTGSVVRLELFLTPEQMHQLLRSILHGAHTVMTLREAAQFLRISNDALKQKAESGEIPAFMVEGRWKFPRNGIEEWLTLQSLQNKQDSQEQHNAA